MAAQVVILTKREREIAALVAQGRTNKEIADELDIADQTVKNHMVSIRRQLRANNRTQVAIWCLTGDRPEVGRAS